VSATVGVSSLCLGGVHPWSVFGSLWRTWWLGDSMGDLMMAPVLLTWANWFRTPWQPRRAAEAVALLVGLGVVSAVVFTGGGSLPLPGYRLEYTIFPFVIWAALRLGPWGSATVPLVAATVAILGTADGLG